MKIQLTHTLKFLLVSGLIASIGCRTIREATLADTNDAPPETAAAAAAEQHAAARTLVAIAPGIYSCGSLGSTADDPAFGDTVRIDIAEDRVFLASDRYKETGATLSAGDLASGQSTFGPVADFPRTGTSASVRIARHQYEPEGGAIFSLAFVVEGYDKGNFFCDPGEPAQDPWPETMLKLLKPSVSLSSTANLNTIVKQIVQEREGVAPQTFDDINPCHLNQIFPTEALCEVNYSDSDRWNGVARIRLKVEKNTTATAVVDYRSQGSF